MRHNVQCFSLLLILFVSISLELSTKQSSRVRRQSNCICVDKKLCDKKTSRIISNGEGIINIRSLRSTCAENEVCCTPPITSTTEAADSVDPNDPTEGERVFEGFYGEDAQYNNEDESFIDQKEQEEVNDEKVEEVIKEDKVEEDIKDEPEVEFNEESSSDGFEKVVTESSSSSFFLCGSRTESNSQILKISGDEDKTETAEGEFPWMLLLKYQLPEAEHQILKLGDKQRSYFLCGASLIYSAVAITAAHCLDHKRPENLIVRAGEWDLGNEDEAFFAVERRVKKVVIHPSYDKYPIKNDLALLILDESFQSSPAINTICIPHRGLNLEWSACYATGWGAKSQDPAPVGDQTLRKAKIPLVPRDKCQDFLRTTKLGKRFKLHKSFLCAGGEDETDTCKGDGGGPLACEMKQAPNSFFLIGVTSWGVGCSQKGEPGMYVDIVEMSDWINFTIKQLIEANEIPDGK